MAGIIVCSILMGGIIGGGIVGVISHEEEKHGEYGNRDTMQHGSEYSQDNHVDGETMDDTQGTPNQNERATTTPPVVSTSSAIIKIK